MIYYIEHIKRHIKRYTHKIHANRRNARHQRLYAQKKHVAVKVLNEIIEMHCHKGLSAAKIFKVLKETVSHSGLYKAVKRFKRDWQLLTKEPQRGS